MAITMLEEHLKENFLTNVIVRQDVNDKVKLVDAEIVIK